MDDANGPLEHEESHDPLGDNQDPDWTPPSESLTPQRTTERNVLLNKKYQHPKRTAFSSTSSSGAKKAKYSSSADSTSKNYRRSSPGGDSNSLAGRSTEALVVEEVQGLRQEVRGINRNLEKLVDVHNRLNDTIERFLTSVRLRL